VSGGELAIYDETAQELEVVGSPEYRRVDSVGTRLGW
jgi:hypothetical protein